MNLCAKKHDEVCFEGRDCPVCDKMSDIEQLQDETKELSKRIEQLEKEAE